jgi:hypothetical protein
MGPGGKDDIAIVMFIQGFAADPLGVRPLGISFPDGSQTGVPAEKKALNCSYVAESGARVPRAAAHEIGHLLTNQILTADEASGNAQGWARGGHYGGPNGVENLMYFGALDPGGGCGTKRLWNDPYHIVLQIDRLRVSRFVR